LTFFIALGFGLKGPLGNGGAWGVTVPGFDLYEFPEGYIGRKTYKTVQGHSKSIPALYTYRGTDGRNHVLPEYGGDDRYFANGAGPMILSDISPFRSPVDNSVIGGRASLREHNKRNDVVQIGNDRITPTERAPMRRAGTDIKRALETARS
jgi:hypothetical protein